MATLIQLVLSLSSGLAPHAGHDHALAARQTEAQHERTLGTCEHAMYRFLAPHCGGRSVHLGAEHAIDALCRGPRDVAWYRTADATLCPAGP